MCTGLPITKEEIDKNAIESLYKLIELLKKADLVEVVNNGKEDK